MDSLIHQLQRRYPGVDWPPNGFGFRGTSESGAVFAVSPVIQGGRHSGEWIAAAATRNGAVPDVVRELMPSRWALLLFGMALACGAGGMWTITGGGQ